MSVLPGLSLTEPTLNAANVPPPPTKISLSPGCEWRFEVAFGQTARVKLLTGTAELFGTELAVGQTYTFSGAKAAIYTWHGATLEVVAGPPVTRPLGLGTGTNNPSLSSTTGEAGVAGAAPGSGAGGCQVEYVAEETPMVEYANAHFALETARAAAASAAATATATATGAGAGAGAGTGTTALPPAVDSIPDDLPAGPRVLLLGPANAGKTSLAKLLTAYATKRGRQPMVVNLDPAAGMLSVPGTLTAAAVRSMLDIEAESEVGGWGSSPTSGPSPAVPVKLPLVYFYPLPGVTDAEGKLFRPLVSRMGVAVAGRMAEDRDAREAGVIVDTPGVLGQGGKVAEEILHHIITEFSISIIFVLGSERLYSSMIKSYDNKPIAGAPATSPDRIAVVKLSKSGGVVDRDRAFLRAVREAQVRTYFFGSSVPSTAASTLSAPTLSAGEGDGAEATATATGPAGTVMALSPHAQMVDLASFAIYAPAAGGEGEGPDNAAAAGGSGENANDEDDDDDDYDPAALTLNDSVLPRGATDAATTESTSSSLPSANSSSLTRVDPATAPAAFEHTLLAVTAASPSASPAAVRDASVLGFVYVADVEGAGAVGGVGGKKLGPGPGPGGGVRARVLAPMSGRVPARAMVWGKRWPGEVVGLLG